MSAPSRPAGIGSGREMLAAGQSSSRRREAGRNGAKREVKRTGSGAVAVPDQASNGRRPGPRLRGAERSRCASARQGDADVRAPAGRRRSAPAAQRSAWRNGGRASDAVCGRVSLGVRRSALRRGGFCGRTTVDPRRPGSGALRRAPKWVRGELPWAGVADVRASYWRRVLRAFCEAGSPVNICLRGFTAARCAPVGWPPCAPLGACPPPCAPLARRPVRAGFAHGHCRTALPVPP